MRKLFDLSWASLWVLLACVAVRGAGYYWLPTTEAPPRCPSECSCQHQPQHNTTALRCRDLFHWGQVSGVKENVAVDFVSRCLPRIPQSAFPSDVPVTSVGILGNTDIEPGAFHNIRSSLQQVTLSGVQTYLDYPLHFLSHLPSLRKLVFGHPPSEGAPIADLMTSPFESLEGTSLDTVEIWFNEIDYYPPQVFRGLAARRLVIVDQVWTFPGEALRSVANLSELVLRNTAIARLRHADTQGLGLRTLDVSGSPLASLDPSSLLGVRDTLTQLYLEDNRLSRVPLSALAPLHRLQHLSLKGNRIQSFDEVLEGEYCLESVVVGGRAGAPLAWLREDALAPHAPCLLSVALLQTNLSAFPTALLRPLHRLLTVELESSALTELRSDALTNVSLSLLSIAAPLELIQPGVFSQHRGLDLELSGVRLQTLSFFFQYPLGTFHNIRLLDVMEECSCELGAIRHHLQQTEYGSGQRGRLQGKCSFRSQTLDLELHSEAVDSIFDRCPALATVAPPVQVSGGVTSQGSLALALLVSLASWLLFDHDL